MHSWLTNSWSSWLVATTSAPHHSKKPTLLPWPARADLLWTLALPGSHFLCPPLHPPTVLQPLWLPRKPKCIPTSSLCSCIPSAVMPFPMTRGSLPPFTQVSAQVTSLGEPSLTTFLEQQPTTSLCNLIFLHSTGHNLDCIAICLMSVSPTGV